MVAPQIEKRPQGRFVAGGRGFEPLHTDPESAVLPLDEPPTADGILPLPWRCVKFFRMNLPGILQWRRGLAFPGVGRRRKTSG